jgi:hypothetical protein
MTAAVAVHPATGRTNKVSLWISVAAVAAAFVTLAVWFVVTLSTGNNSNTTPAGHQGGGGGQYNQLCAPAPGTHYC